MFGLFQAGKIIDILYCTYQKKFSYCFLRILFGKNSTRKQETCVAVLKHAFEQYLYFTNKYMYFFAGFFPAWRLGELLDEFSYVRFNNKSVVRFLALKRVNFSPETYPTGEIFGRVLLTSSHSF